MRVTRGWCPSSSTKRSGKAFRFRIGVAERGRPGRTSWRESTRGASGWMLAPVVYRSTSWRRGAAAARVSTARKSIGAGEDLAATVGSQERGRRSKANLSTVGTVAVSFGAAPLGRPPARSSGTGGSDARRAPVQGTTGVIMNSFCPTSAASVPSTLLCGRRFTACGSCEQGAAPPFVDQHGPVPRSTSEPSAERFRLSNRASRGHFSAFHPRCVAVVRHRPQSSGTHTQGSATDSLMALPTQQPPRNPCVNNVVLPYCIRSLKRPAGQAEPGKPNDGERA